MAKKTASPARADARKRIELMTLPGKRDGKAYLLVKGHIKKDDFFAAFVAHDLKRACEDILGMPIEAGKRTNSNKLAQKVWEKAKPQI